MTHGRGGRAAKTLDQCSLRIRDLIRFSPPPQLGDCIYSLIHTGSASRESARLHAAHRCARNPSLQADFMIGGEFPTIASAGKPNRFELQRGVDAEHIV